MAELLKSAGSAFLLPVLLLEGVYSGFFTATEVPAVYAILLTIARRALSAGPLNTVFFRAGISSAAIMFVIGLTSLLNKAMILEKVPQTIAGLATGFTNDPLEFLWAVNLALLQ